MASEWPYTVYYSTVVNRFCILQTGHSSGHAATVFGVAVWLDLWYISLAAIFLRKNYVTFLNNQLDINLEICQKVLCALSTFV